MRPLTETWHRVAWQENGKPRVVDHATEATAERYAATLAASGHAVYVYAVQIEAVEEAL